MLHFPANPLKLHQLPIRIQELSFKPLGHVTLNQGKTIPPSLIHLTLSVPWNNREGSYGGGSSPRCRHILKQIIGNYIIFILNKINKAGIVDLNQEFSIFTGVANCKHQSKIWYYRNYKPLL